MKRDENHFFFGGVETYRISYINPEIGMIILKQLYLKNHVVEKQDCIVNTFFKLY